MVLVEVLAVAAEAVVVTTAAVAVSSGSLFYSAAVAVGTAFSKK